MAPRPFGKSQNMPHFPELEQFYLSAFCQNAYFLEVDGSIEVSDIEEPGVWGPQRLVKRGDILHVMREDNAFYAMFICESTTAGYPSFKRVSVVRRDIQEDTSPHLGEDGVKFILGAGFVGTLGGEIVVRSQNKAEAEAELAKLRQAAA